MLNDYVQFILSFLGSTATVTGTRAREPTARLSKGLTTSTNVRARKPYATATYAVACRFHYVHIRRWAPAYTVRAVVKTSPRDFATIGSSISGKGSVYTRVSRLLETHRVFQRTTQRSAQLGRRGSSAKSTPA